jgi:hypothetical protein
MERKRSAFQGIDVMMFNGPSAENSATMEEACYLVFQPGDDKTRDHKFQSDYGMGGGRVFPNRHGHCLAWADSADIICQLVAQLRPGRLLVYGSVRRIDFGLGVFGLVDYAVGLSNVYIDRAGGNDSGSNGLDGAFMALWNCRRCFVWMGLGPCHSSL